MVVQQCAGTPCQHIQLFDPLSSSLTKKKKTTGTRSVFPVLKQEKGREGIRC